MKVLKTYRYVIAVLLMLCQLLCSVVSDDLMPTGDDFFEIQSDVLPDDFNTGLSSINKPNATGSRAEDLDSTPMPTEQSDESIGLPVSGSTIVMDVVSTINLELLDTLSLMSQGQLEAFHEITVGFLAFYLFNGDMMPSLVQTEGLEVEVIGQTRSYIDESVQQRNDIAEPLYVGLQVTGKINLENTVETNPMLADRNLEFDQVLKEIFTEMELEYLESLKFIDGDYFASVDKANIVPEEEISQGNNLQNSGEKAQKPIDPLRPYLDNPESSTSGNGLSLGAIIGIAVSAAVLLIAVAVFLFVRGRSGGGTKKVTSSPRKKTTWNQRKELKDRDDSVANANLLAGNQVSSDRSYLAGSDDLESQGMYSYNRSQSSAGSVYTNGSTIKLFSNYSSNFGSDNLSYAYSLEQGIEASVVDGMIPSNGSGSGMPIREIPQVSMNTAKSGAVDRSKSNTKNKKEEYVMQDHFGNTQIETAPSDLKLTKSELAMLPSNLRSSTDESDLSSGDFNENNSKFVTGKILASAGKLGIVVDTSVDGPVVHSVNEDSQISGEIFPGDIIIAINDVDTRAMSSSAITAVMIKTAKQERTLTVRRKS